MRYAALLVSAFMLSLVLVFASPQEPAFASFHCMRIHAVMGGFNGGSNIPAGANFGPTNTIQYVELRMNAPFQVLVASHIIQFFDASGVLKATFTFPSGVTNASTGDSILIATQEFNANVKGGTADFVFSNANTTGANGGDPLHPVQSPGGKVVYAPGFAGCPFPGGTMPVDSVAYGGALADYGTAAVALPIPRDNRVLRLSNLNLQPMNNSTEYSLQPVSTTTFAVMASSLPTDFTTPRNNARTVLQLSLPPSVGGVALEPAAAGGHRTGESRNSGANYAGYGILAGAFAVAAAAAAGLYARRRRRR